MDRMRVGELVGGRYRLGAPLGRGAMGQVFRATDERLRREVAVKAVDLTSTTDRSVAERFHREAIATAQLNHPNIVTIFDAGSDGQTAWLVMELLSGRPVSQVLREEGCNVLDKFDDSEYGKFGWVVDPEGNKVELWEPPPGQ